MFLSSSVFPDGARMEHVNRGQPTERVINHIQSQCDNTEGSFRRELNFLEILSNSSFKRRLTWDLSCEHQSRKEEWSWILRGKSTIERALLGNCEIDDRVGERWKKLKKTKSNFLREFLATYSNFPICICSYLWRVGSTVKTSFFVASGLHSGGLEGWREG